MTPKQLEVTEFIKKQIEIYLEYKNDFVSLTRYREHYKITFGEAEQRISDARKVYEYIQGAM